jgi:hypothetical protein
MQFNRLDNVAGKEHVDDPVTQDAQFAFCSRELGEIDPTPQDPGKETGEAHTFDFSARCLMTNDAQEPERVKMEWQKWTMVDTGVNIMG